MTEKRFSIFNAGLLGQYIKCDGRPIPVEDVVDLLNRLSKENEQLKKELNSFEPVMFQDVRKGTVTLYSKGGY